MTVPKVRYIAVTEVTPAKPRVDLKATKRCMHCDQPYSVVATRVNGGRKLNVRFCATHAAVIIGR